MGLLVIDTAGPVCAVAYDDTPPDSGETGDNRASRSRSPACPPLSRLCTRTEAMPRGHAEVVLDFIADVLERAGRNYEDIHKIAVTTGPGSFTGQRVAISVGRGLGLALGVSVVGIGVLDALVAEAVAAAGPGDGWAGAVNDARRDEVFALFAPLPAPQGLSKDHIRKTARAPLTSPVCVSYPVLREALDVERGVLAGSGAERLIAGFPPSRQALWRVSHDRGVAALSTLVRLAHSARPQDAPAKPFYLRPPDARPSAGAVALRGPRQ